MKLYQSFALIASLFIISCGSSKPVVSTPPQPKVINLALTTDAHANRYVNLDYGIRLNFQDSRPMSRLLKKHDNYTTTLPQVTVNPEIKSFVNESVRRYMRTMGFNLDSDVSTDYIMTVNIREYNLSYLSGIGWSGNVQLNVQVNDHNNQVVYPNVTAVGRANISAGGNDYTAANTTINRAYAEALEDIDWDRIAFFLKRQSNPANEANKKVEGEGNTALEHTIIRWYIDSTPKGADVTWRVVSSTPEVKNTMTNYIGSTPFETTESFDIKGMTYNNSGNIQIEVSCEKAGYITQKKRFNLRQVLDQKEISTKFNLVREE